MLCLRLSNSHRMALFVLHVLKRTYSYEAKLLYSSLIGSCGAMVKPVMTILRYSDNNFFKGWATIWGSSVSFDDILTKLVCASMNIEMDSEWKTLIVICTCSNIGTNKTICKLLFIIKISLSFVTVCICNFRY